MNILTAERKARALMNKHGLYDWSFGWDRAVRRFGLCSHRDRKITLSRRLTELNDEAQVTDTILHEIAHAMIGPGHGHGGKWKRQARAIGADPTRTYDSTVVQPTARYKVLCKNCGQTGSRERKPRKYNVACAICCAKYNGGKFTDKYALTYIDMKEKK